MPINAGYKYVAAEQEYHQAETDSQRMKALRNMLSTAPTHKGAERLRADIKRRIAQLKEEIVKTKKQGKGRSFSIKREGAVQIVFIGLPNSGKSTLLSKLSGKEIKIADYEFTTTKPEVASIKFENVWMQGVELPAVYGGYSDHKQGRQFLSMIRSADFIVVVVKEFKDIAKIQAELKKANILLRKIKRLRGFEQEMPHMIVTWKDFDKKNLVKNLWKAQKLIRVQTRVGHKIAPKPIVLPNGSTVEDVAQTIHKDMIKKFRFAKIRGPSAAFRDQQVGLEHVLKDTDVLEVFMQ
ncbi:TGS domain-containing protein [Candidatus Woesearchaeota archaeon]|nr:TGS domain-containing protein [Candidatus Woesearchaeota archaeon]MBT4114667.1 TGS domain-containing protein [Candidatus Woesearchaeota archaeon]MBT4248529.1 TGS domain-containing protein [Candidatus Woesearchaeota archaeon]